MDSSLVTTKAIGQSSNAAASGTSPNDQSQASTHLLGGTSGSCEKLPFYENIDNFESTVPTNELVLCHRGCQSDFSAIDGLHINSKDTYDGGKRQDVSHDETDAPIDPLSVNNTGAKYVRVKAKPKVPERTVSLGVQDGSKTLGGSTRICRDASTQYGGVLKVIMLSGVYS